jgi:hypothetical protein
MMVSDDKKAKPNPGPKKEDAAKSKATPDAAPAKAEGKPDAAPGGYSRGEGQKPVTQAYKDNWNAIFGKKKKR